VKERTIRSVKPEIRVVGIDDGVFVPHTHGKCDVIGIVFRGGYWLDGVMRTQVEIDGLDATDKIAEMITGSPHYGQLRVIMLDGVTFAGFNVVDTMRLHETTLLPVIAITNADKIIRVVTRRGEKTVYIQVRGVEADVAVRIVRNTATRSNVPEALRVAHLIASGLTTPFR